jgi:hypothetical protein
MTIEKFTRNLTGYIQRNQLQWRVRMADKYRYNLSPRSEDIGTDLLDKRIP